MKGYNLEFEMNEVICREGEPSDDIYFLESGKLLICTSHGSQVKAIARIGPGEFIGELSFFDGRPRASHVVAIEKSVVLKIPRSELIQLLPNWYLEIGKNLTKKIRLLDQVINTTNLRKISSEDQKPLTIDEQRTLSKILSK